MCHIKMTVTGDFLPSFSMDLLSFVQISRQKLYLIFFFEFSKIFEEVLASVVLEAALMQQALSETVLSRHCCCQR